MSEQDEIFELRFYNVASGRDGDMRRRVQKDLAWLFPKHGVRPLACWSAIAAPALPMFVYLTPWRNMIERSRCWAGFYTDPAWAEVRERTNAGSELVEDYEIYFLRAITGWRDVQGPTGSLDEIVFQRVLVGKAGPAAASLRENELPAQERAGAAPLGSFDVLSGRTLPSAISFLRWPDWPTRRAAQTRIETDDALKAAQIRERTQYGRPLIGRQGSYLLEPVAVDWTG